MNSFSDLITAWLRFAGGKKIEIKKKKDVLEKDLSLSLNKFSCHGLWPWFRYTCQSLTF